MSETVIRHRGEKRDRYDQVTPAEPDEPLSAYLVAPAGGSKTVERARDGQTVQCIVYFWPRGADITNDDELTVRGERYHVVVNDWNVDGRGGLEVLCTRGQG